MESSKPKTLHELLKIFKTTLGSKQSVAVVITSEEELDTLINFLQEHFPVLLKIKNVFNFRNNCAEVLRKLKTIYVVASSDLVFMAEDSVPEDKVIKVEFLDLFLSNIELLKHKNLKTEASAKIPELLDFSYPAGKSFDTTQVIEERKFPREMYAWNNSSDFYDPDKVIVLAITANTYRPVVAVSSNYKEEFLNNQSYSLSTYANYRELDDPIIITKEEISKAMKIEVPFVIRSNEHDI